MPQLMPTPRKVEVGSAVERIAAFAVSARPEHLKSDIRKLFKRNILDSLGCAIAGLQGRPFPALREQFEEYRSPRRCTLIGGGKTSADQAALFNSSLVRYVDLLDSYMAIGGLCHLRRGIYAGTRRSIRNPMQVHIRRAGNGEGLQPRHPARDLCSCGYGETLRTHLRRNRQCNLDRDRR